MPITRTLLPLLLLLALLAPPATTASTRTGSDDVATRVDEAVSRIGLPGFSAVVTRGDTVLWAGGRGHDREGAPMTATHPLRLASLSKSMVAVAVLRLAERGRVALDEPVAAQVPGFAVADPRGGAITVRHLLTQTSGLSDAGIDGEALDSARDPAEAVVALRTARLRSDPGARFAYTNANYEIAARLLETAGGAPFAEVMRREVFAPLGMDHTGIGGRDDAIPGTVSVLGWWAPRTWPASSLSSGGAAGVVSTADDLGRWLRFQNRFQNGFQNDGGAPLLSRAGLATTHTVGPGGEYAMGWIPDRAASDHEVLGHTGSMLTMSSAQIVDPRTGVGVAVASESASLWDDTYAIATSLLATAANSPTAAPPDTSRRVIDGVAAGLTVLALGLGVLGVVRARRWAGRRAGRSRVVTVLRLVPSALAVALAVALPWVTTAVFAGQQATWAVLTTFLASVTVAVVVAGAAGAATLLTRLARLGSAR